MALSRGRIYANNLTNTSEDNPPTTPSTAYVRSSAGCAMRYGGIWNSGSAPRKSRAHHHARDRGEHHCTQNAGAPGADHFFNHEQHGGNRRVEGRRQSCGRANRRDQPHFFARKVQPASECGSDARTHLQRGVLGAQGLPAADRERAHQEFPDDGVERDVAVVNVNGGLGLGDSAAAHVGEKPQHQEGQNQPREGGHHDHAHRPGSERRAQQPQSRVIDGDAETHHCEPGKKPDDHRKQKEKIILAHRQQSANAVGDSGRRRGRGRAKAGAVGRTGRRCRRRWRS